MHHLTYACEGCLGACNGSLLVGVAPCGTCAPCSPRKRLSVENRPMLFTFTIDVTVFAPFACSSSLELPSAAPHVIRG